MNRGALIDKFFTNYPSPEMYRNDAELNERFRAMDEAIFDLEQMAFENRSIKEVQEVQALRVEAGVLRMKITQARMVVTPDAIR